LSGKGIQSTNLKVTLENFDDERHASYRKDSLINLNSNNLKVDEEHHQPEIIQNRERKLTISGESTGIIAS